MLTNFTILNMQRLMSGPQSSRVSLRHLNEFLVGKLVIHNFGRGTGIVIGAMNAEPLKINFKRNDPRIPFIRIRVVKSWGEFATDAPFSPTFFFNTWAFV